MKYLSLSAVSNNTLPIKVSTKTALMPIMLRFLQRKVGGIGISLLILIIGCAPATQSKKFTYPSGTPEWVETITREEIKQSIEKLHKYVDALYLFNTDSPLAWQDAHNRLKEIGDFYLSADEPKLIAQTGSSDSRVAANARKELAKRAKAIKLSWIYPTGYNFTLWTQVRREIQSLGDYARVLAASTLLQLLTDTTKRAEWLYIRFEIVELGDIGFELTKQFTQDRIDKTPDTILNPQQELLVQVFLVLINFGDKSRQFLMEASKHPNKNVRKALVIAIGDAQDITMVDLLEDSARSDTAWEVRAISYENMTKLKPIRQRVGEFLLKAIETEKDEACLKEIVSSLGVLGEWRAVSGLIKLLDHPSYEMTKAVTHSLRKITGQAFQTPLEWKQWWASREK